MGGRRRQRLPRQVQCWCPSQARVLHPAGDVTLDPYLDPDCTALHYHSLHEEFEWVRDMAATPQDARHHAEGDVWTHTRMVCDALAQDEIWPRLSRAERRLMLIAALMHDSGKPATTYIDPTGRIRSPEHSRHGEVLARQVLWELGESFTVRETVAALVRQHMQPRYLPMQRDPRRRLYALSLTLRCDLLAMLARADTRGRIARDTPAALAHLHRFVDLCEQHDCLRAPRTFRSDHARYLYFRNLLNDPDADPPPPAGPRITIMSGLPGSGKDTWIRGHGGGLPVVSLDGIRRELGVSPADEDQREVVRTGRERALQLLRAGRDFIWNATTLGRKHRAELLDMFDPFDPYIRMVHLDAPPALLHARNESRSGVAVVPRDVIERMTRIWSPPDLTECHELVDGTIT